MSRLLLLPFLAVATVAGCTPSAPPVANSAPPVVTVALPVEREFTDAAYFTGRTEGSEFVEVRARVSGYLSKMHFKPGTAVKKDDLLFEIDPRPYEAVLKQSEGTLGQSTARVKRLSADAVRAQRLLANQSIGREEYDKILGDQAEAAASVRAAEANVERAKLDLNWTKVYAPIDGIVSRDLINVGNLVAADQTRLTTIVKQNPIYVYYDIDENTVLRILTLIREGKFKSARENNRVPLRMALANSVGYPFSGYVNFVENRVDPATGTMRIRGVFDNPTLDNGAIAIAPGLFARVRLELGVPSKALLVPERVLLADQAQKFLFVVNDKNEVERRDVQLGPLDEGWQVVEAGLKAGERVIVNGLQRVRPGIVVNPKLAEMRAGPVAAAKVAPAKATAPDLKTTPEK